MNLILEVGGGGASLLKILSNPVEEWKKRKPRCNMVPTVLIFWRYYKNFQSYILMVCDGNDIMVSKI